MVLLHYIILLNCIIIYLSLCLISKLFTLGNMIFNPASRRNYLGKKISDIRQKGMEYLLVIVYYLILLHYHYLFSIVFILLFLSSFTIFYYFFTFTFHILVDLAELSHICCFICCLCYCICFHFSYCFSRCIS